MLSRGAEKRNALLSDVFSYPLNNDDIGPDLVTALVVQCSNAKHNKNGRKEYAACIRNVDPRMCPIVGFGLYLFSRWYVTKEPFPNLGEKSDWYDVIAMKGIGFYVL